MGAKLYADLHIVPLYKYIRPIFGLPTFQNIVDASDKLYGISNIMYSKSATRYDRIDLKYQQICKKLNIHIPDKMKIPEDELKESIKQFRGS